MKLGRIDLFASFIILIISGIFVLDVFLTSGRPAAFDTPFHITNIAQFSMAMKDGDFPVYWTDGLANYGLPMSIVAHQLTNYTGGLITIFNNDPVATYNIIAFLGIFLSGLFYYFFLRLYFPPVPSFAGVYLFTFSTYKIINFYIRGAMPEIFSGIFLPLVLIGMYLFIKQKKISGIFLLIVSVFLLTLNHPMLLLIYAFVYIPYLVFLLITEGDHLHISLFKKGITWKKLFTVITSFVIGVGMGSYFILPLNLEIKYFYYGLIKNHLTPNSYLGIQDYFKTDWRYFTESEIFTRGHIIQPGILEVLGVVSGIFYMLWKFAVKKGRTITILDFAVFVSLILFVFTTDASDFLYANISILSNIQFPWRILSAFLFLPPIIYAYFFTKWNKEIPIILFIIIVSFLQFPQLYGKNYTQYPKEMYYFTPYNVHSVLMNTIWSGKTEEYPVKKIKPEIIEGKGKILEKTQKNSSRRYFVDAQTPLRMVDYTFYFPGWNVTIDGKIVPIEFQDPEYRGVITYTVPEGKHNVFLSFTDTKVRLLGKILSVVFFGVFILLFIFRKRLSQLILQQ